MLNATIKLNKKVIWVFGLILVMLFLFVFEFFNCSKEKNKLSMNTLEDRIAYITALGYNVKKESEKESQVFIPKVFPQVLEEFNKKQQDLGFDLHNFEEKTLKRYTYNSTDNLIITLFIYNNVLVGREVKNN